MHQEIHSNKRTINRNNFDKKKRERRNRSPLEQMTNNVSMICSNLFDDYFDKNINLLRRYNITNDHNLINQLIEDKFTENQIKNLNPAALVGGFLILDGRNIDANKVEFIFKKEVNGFYIIEYFKSMKVKKEDIIRYARFWLKHLY
jgi:hypothetical protein